MVDLIIISGPPGSGKSSVAGALALRRTPGVHLHTDDFWHAIVSGLIPPYEPAASEQNDTVVGAIASAAVGYAMGGLATVVDGIVGPWMLDHYRGRVADTPIALHYVVLRPSRDVALARATSRTGPDDLVAAGPVLHMWDEFADLGQLEHHVIDTSDDELAATVESVESVIRSGGFRLR